MFSISFSIYEMAEIKIDMKELNWNEIYERSK